MLTSKIPRLLLEQRHQLLHDLMINALLGRSKKSSKKTEVLDESLRPLGKSKSCICS